MGILTVNKQPRKHYNHKYIRNKYWHTILKRELLLNFKTKINPKISNSTRFQYPTLSNRQVIWTKNKQRNIGIKWYQMVLTDICIIFHLRIEDTHSTQQPKETSLKVNCILTYKIYLNGYKKIWIPYILSDQNAIKLKIKSKIISSNYTSSLRLNNILLNDESVKEEIKRQINVFLELNENKNTAK